MRSRHDDTARPQLDADARARSNRSTSASDSACIARPWTRSTTVAPSKPTCRWKRVWLVNVSPAWFHTVTTGVWPPRVVMNA